MSVHADAAAPLNVNRRRARDATMCECRRGTRGHCCAPFPMHSATCAQAARARRAYQSSRRLRLEEWYGARTGAAPSVTTALDYRAPVTRERARAKASHGCEDDSTDTSLHGACALKTGSDRCCRAGPAESHPPSLTLTHDSPTRMLNAAMHGGFGARRRRAKRGALGLEHQSSMCGRQEDWYPEATRPTRAAAAWWRQHTG